MTAKGLPCPIVADRMTRGQWYCHVHDPNGVYRQQVNVRIAAKTPKQPKPAKPTRQVNRPLSDIKDARRESNHDRAALTIGQIQDLLQITGRLKPPGTPQ